MNEFCYLGKYVCSVGGEPFRHCKRGVIFILHTVLLPMVGLTAWKAVVQFILKEKQVRREPYIPVLSRMH